MSHNRRDRRVVGEYLRGTCWPMAVHINTGRDRREKIETYGPQRHRGLAWPVTLVHARYAGSWRGPPSCVCMWDRSLSRPLPYHRHRHPHPSCRGPVSVTFFLHLTPSSACRRLSIRYPAAVNDKYATGIERVTDTARAAVEAVLRKLAGNLGTCTSM